MVDRHSFPHYPKYYCTACDDLLTAEAMRDREGLLTHITNSENATHRGRNGNSVSAPITTTGTETDWIDPIWKAEADTEAEQLIYLALLRYPHLPIGSVRTRQDENTSIAELLDIPKKEISRTLFNSPSIARLRARATYEYVNDQFTRPVEKVTVDPKERLIHKKVRTLARDTPDCSIKPNGGFELPALTASDIAEEINDKHLPGEKAETPAINDGVTVSPKEVQNILKNTVIEPQFPEAGHHTTIIAARLTTDTLKEAASLVSDKLDEDVKSTWVGSVTRRRAWRSFDASKLSQLIYDPKTVARDFYTILQETDLEPPASIKKHLPEDATSSTSTTERADPSPASAPQAGQPQQQSTRKPDGGAKTAPTSTEAAPSMTSAFTTASKETTNDIATLVQTTLSNTTAGSEPAKAALNIYGQLPKPTRQAILTDIRTEATDEIFTLLAQRL